MEKTLIVKYGEIGLKGKNRRFFEDLLIKNIRRALRLYDFKLFKTHGRIFIDDLGDKVNEAVEIIKDVFGVAYNTLGTNHYKVIDGMFNIVNVYPKSAPYYFYFKK